MPSQKERHMENVFVNIPKKYHPERVRVTYTIACPDVFLGLHMDICPLVVNHALEVEIYSNNLLNRF
jgi:hypothetical protein